MKTRHFFAAAALVLGTSVMAHATTGTYTTSPVKVGIFHDFAGSAVIYAASGVSHG
jgi:hypothetical protein